MNPVKYLFAVVQSQTDLNKSVIKVQRSVKTVSFISRFY